MRTVAAALLIVGTTAAAGAAAPCGGVAGANWRTVVTEGDRGRLRDTRQALIDAADGVRARPGGPAMLAADPILVAPDAAIGKPALGVGKYRCRTIRLAPRDAGLPPVVTGAWAPCTISTDGKALAFATTGEQRTSGRLYTDPDGREVYLGVLVLGGERRPIPYGRDNARDMAGVVERIGEGRWRLVLPHPAFQSALDLIEIAAT